MTYGEFWTREGDWPRDTATHQFLGRVLHVAGKALFRGSWTGEEPIAAPVLALPDKERSKRRDRIEAHALLQGDAIYEEKPIYVTIPPSLTTGKLGSRHVNDFSFTNLEWERARAIQAETITARQPSWARLIKARSRIIEEALLGNLETAARLAGEITLRSIPPDYWSIVKDHEVFDHCTMPAKHGVVINQPPIFVSKASVIRVFDEIEAQSQHGLADENDAAQDRGDAKKAGNPNSSQAEELPRPTEIGFTTKQVHEAAPDPEIEYIARVKTWPADARPPSREDDERKFRGRAKRELVREWRRKHAPANWQNSGRPNLAD